MAFELIAIHHAQVQGHLAMGTAILQRDTCPLYRDKHNREGRKAAAERLAHLELIGPGQRIPIVRMRAYPTQVERIG